MAWRSSGTNNEEMVDNLKSFQVISKDEIERAFRSVDRRCFVPPNLEDSAYLDQPLKEGHVHISAPHIYGSALEALELEPGSCSSFLNIGSGTGYLSCIVAEILGPKSVNFGIEIREDVVDHSRKSIKKWLSTKQNADSPVEKYAFPHLQIVHGNALHIESSKGECLVGFDRIYVGAAVDRSDLPKITKLLSPGGVLVGPVEDELVKIIRIGPIPQVTCTEQSCRKRVHEESSTSDDHSNVSEGSNSNYEFSHQVLSGVRFTPLISAPVIPTVLPARLWNPSLQKYYPESFRKATLELMLCSNSEVVQPLPRPKKPDERVNFAAMLPRVVWLDILSYTHRKWFEPEQTETEYLKKRILEEQSKAIAAQQARIEAENRSRLLERERDLYRLLARRWQSRIQLMLQQQRQLSSAPLTSNAQGVLGTRTGALGVGTMSGEERAVIYGLGSMLQQTMDDGTEDDEGGIFFPAHDSAMEEETDDGTNEEGQDSTRNDDDQLIDFLERNGESDQEEEDEFHQSSEHEDQIEVATSAVAVQEDMADGEDNESVVMDESGTTITANSSRMSLSVKASRLLMGLQPRTVSLGDDDDL